MALAVSAFWDFSNIAYMLSKRNARISVGCAPEAFLLLLLPVPLDPVFQEHSDAARVSVHIAETGIFSFLSMTI